MPVLIIAIAIYTASVHIVLYIAIIACYLQLVANVTLSVYLYIQVCGPNISMKLPLSLLLHSAVNIQRFDLEGNLSDSTFAQHQAVSSHIPQLLDSSPHEFLTTTASYSCPFVKVNIEAPSCDAITRSKLHVVREGMLRWISEDSLPEKNCDVFGNDLPAEIFLKQSESYHFSVHFMIDPRITSEHKIMQHFVVRL